MIQQDVKAGQHTSRALVQIIRHPGLSFLWLFIGCLDVTPLSAKLHVNELNKNMINQSCINT